MLVALGDNTRNSPEAASKANLNVPSQVGPAFSLNSYEYYERDLVSPTYIATQCYPENVIQEGIAP
jgi:hypothetical protein